MAQSWREVYPVPWRVVGKGSEDPLPWGIRAHNGEMVLLLDTSGCAHWDLLDRITAAVNFCADLETPWLVRHAPKAIRTQLSPRTRCEPEGSTDEMMTFLSGQEGNEQAEETR